jgi:hypothetical protein
VSAENNTNYSAAGVGKADELRDALPQKNRLSDVQPSPGRLPFFAA